MSSRLGDLIRQIRDPNLGRQRLDDLVRQLNEFGDRADKVQSWTRFTDSNPWFDLLRARVGEFEVSPIDGILLNRTGTPQSIPDNAITNVSFDSFTGDNNSFKLMSGSKVGVTTKHYIIGAFGTAEWANNGTGRRGVGMAAYDSTDTQVYGVTLNSLLPTNIANDTHPFAGGITISDFLDVTSVRLNVYQNSGGALNLENFRVYLFVLK